MTKGKKSKNTSHSPFSDRKPFLSVTIKDCRVDTFRAGGNGGQKQNKTSSGVRVVHEPSGAVGESREERSQLQNKKTAFRRMAESNTFQQWLRKQLAQDDIIRSQVERQMWEVNLKTEVKDENGNWVTTKLPVPMEWWKE